MREAKGIPYKWLALLTVSIGTFMATLDASIVNISFPRLTEVFETDPSVVLWVSVAYFLACVGLMLTFSSIGDVLGRKRVYIWGFALFTAGLIACSLSQSIFQLILSRIFQGMGASMTVGLANAIVTAVFPSRERGRALGILGAVVSAGLLTGPVLGGFLLDTLDWRAIFYARVPIGIIGLVMAWVLLKEQRGSNVHLKLDLWGAVTLFSSLSCLILFLNFGGRWGFASPVVLTLASSAVVLLALFIVLERRAAQPVVDLSLFQNRLFAAANISLGIIFVAQIAFAFLMPFYLIDGLDYSASEAGVLIVVVALITLVIGPLSGWLSDKIGSRLLCTVGIALVSLALFLLSRLGAESSEADILLSLMVLGIGAGMFQSPNYSSIMGSVTGDRLGTASALSATVRQIGIIMGMAITGTLFASRQFFYATQFTLGGFSPVMVHRLSVVSGFQDAVLFAAIISGIGIFTSLVRGKQRPSD